MLFSRPKVVFSALVFLGLMTLWYATRWGIGVSTDSAVYLRLCDKFYTTGNPFVPTFSPPLYPIAICSLRFLGMDSLGAARVLNLILFGANILLVGFLIHRSTGNLWISYFGTFIMLSCEYMLQLHAMAWSEPLFLFLGFSGFYFLMVFLETQQRWTLLYASMLIGLSFLTRYAGAAFVVSGVFGILLLGKDNPIRRIKAAVLLGILSSLPTFLWFTKMHAGITSRQSKIIFHPGTFDELNAALYTVSIFLVPENVPGVVKRIVLILFVLAFTLLLLQLGRPRNKFASQANAAARSSAFIVIFILCYVLLLAITISFYWSGIPLELPGPRYLSPLFVAGLALVTTAAHAVLYPFKEKGTIFQFTVIVLCALFTISYAYRGALWVDYAHEQGLGYTGKKWKESQMLERIKKLPSGACVYTNAIAAVVFLTGRGISSIPVKLSEDNIRNQNYESQLLAMKQELRQKDGVIYYCYFELWRTGFPTEKELKEQIPLQLIAISSDGALYKTANGSP